ncbi:MAG TPA: tetratricopeptide repeat protein [Candidatus Gastranaerophilaceae bacterium]|nr:tetratricopeptide repeat protein [Candidatus Gastranaerophilaceae bacterium]HPT40783.1 tetratricopeptide repeat protein [Candidatus Gastranaerophilaceae bacterium]
MKKILVLLLILISTSLFATAQEANTEAVLQYNQGIDYYKAGEYDKSTTAFKTAISLDPDYIDAYYNLGSVLEFLGKYEEALVIFKQVVVRKPDDYDSVYKAAWLSKQLGQNQKALTYLSIIPIDCERAKDAQVLAQEIKQQGTVQNIDVSAPIKEVKISEPKISQSNFVYQNILAPTGITSDSEGNLYVAEFNNNLITKITPDNKKIIFVKDSKISGPIGLATDKTGNIYVANYNKDNVLKISVFGEITVLIGNLKKPYYLYVKDNMLFVSCQGTDTVLRYKLN